MTQNEALREFDGIKYRYLKDKNSAETREELQRLFEKGFDSFKTDTGFKAVLERAYTLLRQVENEKEAPLPVACRFDISFAVEDLVFCANILLGETGRSVKTQCDFEKAFVALDLKSFSLAFFSLLANAAKYSDACSCTVKLSLFDSFVSVSITNTGSFGADEFHKAVAGNGSLGFVNRLLLNAGGSLVMTEGDGKVTLALKIPTADDSLPCTLPLSVDDLLYDRLSVMYIAFCGH